MGNPEVEAQETTEIARAEHLPMAPPTAPPEIVALLNRAVDKGVDVHALKELVTLYERVKDREARIEFTQAFNQFQQKCPMIPKRTTGTMASAGGTSFQWKYAEIDDIVRVVNPLLFPLGFSYRWDSKIDGKDLQCIFWLSHIGGHKEPSRFDCTTDAPGAKMSSGQNNSKALSIAQRRSMVAGLGLTACNEDNDGGLGKGDAKITQDELTNIEDLIKETEAPLPNFLECFGIERVEDLAAANYTPAKKLLERRRDKKS